jgi:TonB family protein
MPDLKTTTAMLYLIASAVAQQPPPPPPEAVRVGPGVSQPRLLEKIEPTYTQEASRAKLQGIVTVELVVNATGVAVDFKVKHSLGLGLDEAAVRAVKQWRFAPGEKGGVPVAVFATVNVSFRLLTPQGTENRGWSLTRAVFDGPADAPRPVLIRCEYPHQAPAERAVVALSFEINSKGEPANLNVDKAVDSKPEQEIIAAVKKWRFKPAMKDGVPIPAHATFEFIGHAGAK